MWWLQCCLCRYGSPKWSFHWSPFLWPVCCFDTWYLRQQGPEGPVVFVSRNRERALTGHRTWSRLNYHAIMLWFGDTSCGFMGVSVVHSIFIKRFTKARQNKTKQNKSKAKQKEKSKGNGSKRITEACQIKILTDPHGRLRWGVIKRACGNHAVFFSSNQICGDCFPANSVKWIQGPGLLDGGWFLHVRFLSPQNNNIIWVFSVFSNTTGERNYGIFATIS